MERPTYYAIKGSVCIIQEI